MTIIEPGSSRAAFIEAGAGETVLLLHASASTGSQWRNLMQMMKRLCHLVAPDLCGYGDAEAWPGQRAFSLSDEVRLVDALMVHRPASIHLVGHSYGGAVALQYARQNPSRVRSLTLIEPVAFHLLRHEAASSGDHLLYQEISDVSMAIAQAVASGDLFAGMERFVDYWNGRDSWARTEVEVQRKLARKATEVALNFWATMTADGRREDYQQISVPTLILRGSRSPRPTQRIAELIEEILPFSRLRTVEGAGHMLPLTHPEEVALAITAQLFPGIRRPIHMADASA